MEAAAIASEGLGERQIHLRIAVGEARPGRRIGVEKAAAERPVRAEGRAGEAGVEETRASPSARRIALGAIADGPEQALVDGILELGAYSREGRLVRELQVRKLRGSNPLLGRNVFRIDGSGIVVYPRLEEAVARRVNAAAETHEKAAFGIAQLDAMTEGGLTRGASTVLLGAPGSGKTLLGLM